MQYFVLLATMDGMQIWEKFHNWDAAKSWMDEMRLELQVCSINTLTEGEDGALVFNQTYTREVKIDAV